MKLYMHQHCDNEHRGFYVIPSRNTIGHPGDIYIEACRGQPDAELLKTHEITGHNHQNGWPIYKPKKEQK